MTFQEVLNIVSFVAAIISIIAALKVLIKIGEWKGRQEQINENQKEINDRHDNELCTLGGKIDKVDANLQGVAKDVSMIKGALKL